MSDMQELQSKSYMQFKPSWDAIDEKYKYLVWAYYVGWFAYEKDDPWLSTHFVDYVEDRNGNKIKYIHE